VSRCLQLLLFRDRSRGICLDSSSKQAVNLFGHFRSSPYSTSSDNQLRFKSLQLLYFMFLCLLNCFVINLGNSWPKQKRCQSERKFFRPNTIKRVCWGNQLYKDRYLKVLRAPPSQLSTKFYQNSSITRCKKA